MIIGIRIQNFLHVKDSSICLDPAKSQLIGLVGRSRSGKTTLLKAIEFLRCDTVFPQELEDAKVTVITEKSIFCRTGEFSFELGPLSIESDKLERVEESQFFHQLDKELKIYLIESKFQFAMLSVESPGFAEFLVSQVQKYYKGFSFGKESYYGERDEKHENALAAAARLNFRDSEKVVKSLNSSINSYGRELSACKKYFHYVNDSKNSQTMDTLTQLISSMRVNLFNYYISQKEKLTEHQPLLTESVSLRDANELIKEPILKTVDELKKLSEENENHIIQLFRFRAHNHKLRERYAYYVIKSKLPYQLKMNEEYYQTFKNALANAYSMPEKEAKNRIKRLRNDQIESLSEMARIERHKKIHIDYCARKYLNQLRRFNIQKKDLSDTRNAFETSLVKSLAFLGGTPASTILENMQKLDQRFIGSIFDNTITTDQIWIPLVQCMYHHLDAFYIIVNTNEDLIACTKIMEKNSGFIKNIMIRAGEERPLALITLQNCENFEDMSFPPSLKQKYQTGAMLSSYICANDPQFTNAVRFAFRNIIYVPEIFPEDRGEFSNLGIRVIQDDQNLCNFSKVASNDFTLSFFGDISKPQENHFDLSSPPKLGEKVQTLIRKQRSIFNHEKSILILQDLYTLAKIRSIAVSRVLRHIRHAKTKVIRLSEANVTQLASWRDPELNDGEIKCMFEIIGRLSEQTDLQKERWKALKKANRELLKKLHEARVKGSQIRLDIARRCRQDNTERVLTEKLEAKILQVWGDLPYEIKSENLKKRTKLDGHQQMLLKDITNGGSKSKELKAAWKFTLPFDIRLEDPCHKSYEEFLNGVNPTESFLLENIKTLSEKRTKLKRLASQSDSITQEKIDMKQSELDKFIHSKKMHQKVLSQSYDTLNKIANAKFKRMELVTEALTPLCQKIYEYLNGIGARISFEPVLYLNFDVSIRVLAAPSYDKPLREIHELSSGEKTLFLLALHLSVALADTNTLLLVDKIDSLLDKTVVDRVGEVIQGLMKENCGQCIMTLSSSGSTINLVDQCIGAYTDCRLPKDDNVCYCVYKNPMNPSQNPSLKRHNELIWPTLPTKMANYNSHENMSEKASPSHIHNPTQDDINDKESEQQPDEPSSPSSDPLWWEVHDDTLPYSPINSSPDEDSMIPSTDSEDSEHT